MPVALAALRRRRPDCRRAPTPSTRLDAHIARPRRIRAPRRLLGRLPLTRALAGLAVALLVAAAAWRARALAPSGAAAATVVGTIAIAAGWGWGALLVAYFVSSTALSRWRAAEKERRTGSVVAKGGRRDAWQVLANGGAFAGAAIGAIAAAAGGAPALTTAAWGAAGAGALAAAAADTWATEVGTLAAGAPHSVLSWRRVPAGTSGAVSVPGSLALVGGAVAVAAIAAACGVSAWLPAAIGGVAGAVTDTVLGAVVQERRWCGRCHTATERRVHGCGASTERIGGIALVDNDVVNVACTVVGALVAAAAAARIGT